MRRILMTTGLIVALAAPVVAPATAQANCHDRRVAGALLGAVGGGLLGNALARGGGRVGGTIIGAGVGGVVGNSVARSGCGVRRHAYYRHRAEPGYAPASYASSGPACHTETRSFYDARGQLVYAPTQVCG